jgi:predicted MPP superfamily phosphohydrolase
MSASKYIVIPILTFILLLIDWYLWEAIKVAIQSTSIQTQQIIKWIYWVLTMTVLVGLWAHNFIGPEVMGVKLRTFILGSLFVTYCSKLFSLVFILIYDASRFLSWSREKLTSGNEPVNTISRSEFVMKAALLATSVPAVALTWGIISGAHDYHIRRVRLVIKNLPKAFQGLTIAQISDIHTGSFFNRTAVKGGVEMLFKEKAEMVFFTGDLVNDRASEVKDYIDIFNKIKAPLGVYSTLGNHDYGFYEGPGRPEVKKQNLDAIINAHKVLGYDLLLDENRIINVNGEKLAIIGVQNISATESIFHNNGDLAKASKGTGEASVKLLLSHDPSHWDKEVNSSFKDIDIMFSGHTHGGQFGVTIGDRTYSASQLAFKQWAGLYQKGDQQLYVNRGFGYLGYPGRVGMPPEITVFELSAS